MVIAELTNDLRCPKCTRPLEAAQASIACRSCGADWPIESGVWRFGENDGYPLDFSSAETAQLLATAECQGWQAALHDQMREWNPTLYRRAVDEYRAQWRCLLPADPSGRALDLRCGWGTIAAGLAEDYALVVAADTSYSLARFAALRCAALPDANVQAMCVNPRQRLPFRSGYFDVITLHDTLEWGHDQAAQPVALLREVARVLQPDGHLFLTLNNGLNPLHRLQGQASRRQSSHNTDAADRATRAPRRRLRMLGGYERLLAAAGFQSEAVYGILPSVEEPFYIVPANSHTATRFFLDSLFGSQSLHLALSKRHLLAPYQAARALWNLARFLPLEGLIKHLMPAYAIVARKQPAHG